MAKTEIGMGANKAPVKPNKEVEALKKSIAEKDAEIKTLTEDKVKVENELKKANKEIASLKEKVSELEKGGSDDGTNSKDSDGGSGKSKAK